MTERTIPDTMPPLPVGARVRLSMELPMSQLAGLEGSIVSPIPEYSRGRGFHVYEIAIDGLDGTHRISQSYLIPMKHILVWKDFDQEIPFGIRNQRITALLGERCPHCGSQRRFAIENCKHCNAPAPSYAGEDE